MLTVQKNYSLKNENSFHFDVRAAYFVTVHTEKDAQKLIENPLFHTQRQLILGEGSNTLFAHDFDGIIIKLAIHGINIVAENNTTVTIEVGASERWHDTVTHTVDNGWGGIENMALIPGTMGAAPVQNIGAYGKELSDVFVSLRAVNLKTGTVKTFNEKDCRFGYRTSVFKERYKGEYLITAVTIRLQKKPTLDVSYFSRQGSLSEELQKFAQPPYSVKDVYRAIISIRKSKLPDPAHMGNAGSFFKNPIITETQLQKLQKIVPDVPSFPFKDTKGETRIKVPAGWLLDELGWRGRRIGNVGTAPKQALCIVNYGGATPKEVINFMRRMQREFYKHYHIHLEPEVNIIE